MKVAKFPGRIIFEPQLAKTDLDELRVAASPRLATSGGVNVSLAASSSDDDAEMPRTRAVPASEADLSR